MKVGDLVRYLDSPDFYRVGLITDVLEDESSGFPMYEVIAVDPPDRGWFMDIQLEIVDCKKKD